MPRLPVRDAMRLLACFGVVTALHAQPIIREPGAIYLSDFGDNPVKVKVLQPAPAYFDFAGTRYVGTLRVPQMVELQAIADQCYRVRGNAQQGQILGWVDPKYLSPIAPATIDALKKADERRKTVTALIAKKQIAMGMTPAEVEKSIGKPQKKSTHASSSHSVEQVWEYVKYASIPQNTTVAGPGGTVTVVTTYIKTPVGHLTVNFKNDVVESIDQSEGSILTGNETTVVVPPIIVYW